jgi:dipeptidyl aminopeptidase/acylaminoacyl peptidase
MRLTPALHWNVTLRAAVILLLAILAGGPGTFAGDSIFTPYHVARLQRVVDAVIAPSGEHVAYTLSVPRMPLEDEDGRAWTELHLVDQSGNSRPFITGRVQVGSVRWTPDGSYVAYLSKRDGDEHTSLYRIPVGGGESRRLIQHDADIVGYSFSVDGQQLALLATEPVPKPQQEYRNQGFDQEIYEEDWRPTKVWLADLHSPDKKRVLELPGSASRAEWSPDGSQLAVVLAPTPSVDDGYMFRRVHVVDADTGKILDRVPNPGKLEGVTWSPDGKHLALISGADLHDPAAGRLLVAAVPGNGELRDLMPDYEAHVTSVAWSDENTLLWVADHRQATQLGTVSLAGERNVSEAAGDVVLGSLSVTRDGNTVALVGHHPSHPPEVFLLNEDDTHVRRLTVSNTWLDEMRLARQELVSWEAEDGLGLEGVLVYPLNYQPGRRYPLIMVVHGGPESHVPNGWVTSYAYPGQVGAARGFAVFHPNYRGSTGRGVEFSKLGQADAAGKEFSDLVQGVDHLVEAGLVEAHKVGITGGSYGGYASAWGATYYSDRFAASVMFVGISDNISKVGTTDIPEEMYLVHHRKRLWDDWEYFLQRSPIRHVEKNRTPTLILHGKRDPRVHPAQSLELFRHLKTLQQAPSRLVLYEGEGHGNRKAAARLDYNLRMLRWMEHFLQGPGGDAPPRDIDYAEALGKP